VLVWTADEPKSSDSAESISVLNPGFRGTLGKIDFLLASFADVFLFKLVRKNLGFLAAGGALTDKGFQMFHLLKSRAMQRGSHLGPPFVNGLIGK
jgi:hypothetical protein